jgi:hypothetical protein
MKGTWETHLYPHLFNLPSSFRFSSLRFLQYLDSLDHRQKTLPIQLSSSNSLDQCSNDQDFGSSDRNHGSSVPLVDLDSADQPASDHDEMGFGPEKKRNSSPKYDKFHLRAAITFVNPLASIEVIDNDIEFENLTDEFVIRWVRFASTQSPFNPAVAQFVRSCGSVRNWAALRGEIMMASLITPASLIKTAQCYRQGSDQSAIAFGRIKLYYYQRAGVALGETELENVANSFNRAMKSSLLSKWDDAWTVEDIIKQAHQCELGTTRIKLSQQGSSHELDELYTDSPRYRSSSLHPQLESAINALVAAQGRSESSRSKTFPSRRGGGGGGSGGKWAG